MHLPGLKPETEPKAAEPEVEVRIRGLMMDPSTRQPIVVLNDLAGEVVLPIWVGLFEANAIALEIEKATTPRPDDPRPDALHDPGPQCPRHPRRRRRSP